MSSTSIPKDTAKTLLQRQVEKIPDLRAKGRRNPEFEPWRQQTLRIIKRIFGESSDQAKQFDSVIFGLMAFTNRTPESAWGEAFQRGLVNSEVTLKSFAEELDLFEPVKTITTKAKGSSSGDERAIVWDLFICHASEDKNEIAGPLAEALTAKGLSVWYDEFTLTLGDSLSRKIDEGLTNSRFGVVILSPSFFKKEWPRRELDGLTAKEISSGKTILPIWHNVGRDYVLGYSPVLADKLAVSTKSGLDEVVDEILKAINKSNRQSIEKVASVTGRKPSNMAGRTELSDRDVEFLASEWLKLKLGETSNRNFRANGIFRGSDFIAIDGILDSAFGSGYRGWKFLIRMRKSGVVVDRECLLEATTMDVNVIFPNENRRVYLEVGKAISLGSLIKTALKAAGLPNMANLFLLIRDKRYTSDSFHLSLEEAGLRNSETVEVIPAPAGG